jgi:hypothetical protein
MAAGRGGGERQRRSWGVEGSEEVVGVANFQLMYIEGNADGLRELLDAGADPNGRTAMHIRA